jgi:two-component system sensor histidine kinase RpfC
LDALAELGGEDFVSELVGQFVGDAAGVLRDLAAAARQGDATSFREQAHALRSAAANIGARRIYEVCLSWRQMPTEELAANGARYLEQLKAEFDEVRAALGDHLPPPDRTPPHAAPPLKLIRGGRDAALAS